MTSKLEEKENMFPTLGDVVSRTDALRDIDDDDKRLRDDAPAREEEEEGEEREMREVESLCMRCHEQVSTESLVHRKGYIADTG